MFQRAPLLLSSLALFLLLGCFLDDYKSEEVTNEKPTVRISITSDKQNTGDTIQFRAYGNDDNSDITYYDWQIDEKDVDGSEDRLEHVFNDAGDYEIRVRAVVNDDEKSDWADTSITIAKKGAPVANLSIPSTVTFASQVSFSVENDGAGDIESCTWTVDGEDTTTSEKSLSWSFNDSSYIGQNVTVAVVITNDSSVTSEKVSKTLKVIATSYPIHHNIKASCFWVGEGASSDNDNISNFGSSWRSHWALDFGLIDHPTEIARNDQNIPTSDKFTGDENPYYFALPYNDFSNVVYDGKGDHKYTDNMIGGKYGKKMSSQTACYWKEEAGNVSACKNRWAEITYNGVTCYAQWEDAGPYYYEDTAYVFGTDEPLCTQEGLNSPNAGIDLSPSVWLYMGASLKDWGYTATIESWRFVDESDVPDGPWKKHITRSGTYWK